MFDLNRDEEEFLEFELPQNIEDDFILTISFDSQEDRDKTMNFLGGQCKRMMFLQWVKEGHDGQVHALFKPVTLTPKE